MNQQQNIFRVSAILYSNNNYIISPKQIYTNSLTYGWISQE